jgi:hypothetical protein
MGHSRRGGSKSSDMRPLKTIQNECLRSIPGGYKRTPTVALEREACVPPLDLYTEATALQRAVNTTNHPVYKNISGTLDTIWSRLKRTGHGRRGALTSPQRPPTSLKTQAPRTLTLQQACVLRHAGSFAAEFWSNSGQHMPLSRRILQSTLPSRP